MDNYYLFLEESGHHGLKTVNQEFPVFLLCGCLLEQSYFNTEFSNKLNDLKLNYFGTTEIVLHSSDIRKWQNKFKIFGDPNLRHRFYHDLNALISNTKFTIIAAAILKEGLIQEYGPRADNPYNLCLSFILERAMFFTDTVKGGNIEVVAEARGKKEDASLQHQYQLVLSNGTPYVKSRRFQKIFTDITFVKKVTNNLGTQLSDLAAYPIATKVLYSDRENLAFNVFEPKLYRQFPDGDYLGYGLKIFP